jgi:hypothetical protein
MSGEARCLHLIEKVRDAAADPGAAYLIRSRLRRAILGCVRMVADDLGARKPDVPGHFVAPAGSSDTDREIFAVCTCIDGIARELCQPSESFDVRWERGWAILQRELDRLEAAVASRCGPSRALSLP